MDSPATRRRELGLSLAAARHDGSMDIKLDDEKLRAAVITAVFDHLTEDTRSVSR